jgi:TolB-like protein/class 3 adenylate cyclase/tetratricopeptide (TPR) repeat protein
MGPEETKGGRRLAAIFAADVAGYSRLMGQDEEGTLRALSAARATLDRVIADHGGRIVNTAGDSVLAEFPSAVAAVKCAMAAQEKLAQAETEATQGVHLLFRIAVHVGDVLPSGTDIYGDGINVCARLQEIAEPGGVCVSGAAYQYVRKVLSVAFDDLGERRLKNIDEPVRAFAIRAPHAAGQSRPRPKSFAAPWSLQAQPRMLRWIVGGGLAAALVIFLVYQLGMQPGAIPARTTGVEAAKTEAVSPATAISLAVLPFVNLSGDPGQEFFSDGMTEEIITALARIPDLRVVARGSASQFKGERRDMRAVGQALGATHLIEGSVRRAGTRVRITAQLVRANDGVNAWVGSYDRELTDVFAIQEEIATAVAGALRMPLGLRPGETLVSNRAIDPESYEQYLRAMGMIRSRGIQPISEGASLLDQIVTRSPNYAPAWALLAQAHAQIPNFEITMVTGSPVEMRGVVEASIPKAEAAARRAIELDPNLADGYSSLGLVERVRGNLLAAEELFLKALALDALNPDALHLHSRLQFDVGRLKEALQTRQRLQAVEPFVPIFNAVTAMLLSMNGQVEEAIAILNRLPPSETWHGYYLARLYADMGRYNDAADALLQIPGQFGLTAKDAAPLLRTATTKRPPPKTLPALYYDWFVYPYVGASDRYLTVQERSTEAGYTFPYEFGEVWYASLAPVRKMDRFKAYVRKAGYVDYWRAKGWPDFCRPVGADDFECS